MRSSDILKPSVRLGLPLLLLSATVIPAPAAEPEWAGSRACERCHGAIYRSYSRTPMARSSGTVKGADVTSATFNDRGSGADYRIRREKGDLLLDIYRGNRPLAGRRLTYFVGSGSKARSFLIPDSEGFLFEAPVTYYAREGWRLSPGFARYRTPHLSRAVTPGCLECHATGVRSLPEAHNGYAKPPFVEGGVGCERCHGPGAAHAAGRGGVVNPAKLTSARRDDVCAQCHLTGFVRVPRAGKRSTPYVAGEPLADWVSVFIRSSEEPRGRLRVTSHAEKLAQSRCKQASGAALWCGSCHSVHAPASSYKEKCVQCHAMTPCKEALAVRQGRGDDCIECHMTKQAVADAEHVVFTDHSIPRRPATTVDPPEDAPLRVFQADMSAADREWGLALAIGAQRRPNAVYERKATELLSRAAAAGARDSEVLLYLAELYRKQSRIDEASALFEETIRTAPAQLTGSVTLGAIRAEQGRFDEAIRLWRDALRKNPGLPLVRWNLAAVLLRESGSMDEAEAHLLRALEFQPIFPAAEKLLHEITKKRKPLNRR